MSGRMVLRKKEKEQPIPAMQYYQGLSGDFKEKAKEKLSKYYNVEIETDEELYFYTRKFQKEIFGHLSKDMQKKLIDGRYGQLTDACLGLALAGKKIEIKLDESKLFNQRTEDEWKKFIENPLGFTGIFYLSDPELYCRILERLIEEKTGKKVTVEWFSLGLKKEDERIFQEEMKALFNVIKNNIEDSVSTNNPAYLREGILTPQQWKQWRGLALAFKYIKITLENGKGVIFSINYNKDKEEIELKPTELSEKDFYSAIEKRELFNIDMKTGSTTWFICKFRVLPEMITLDNVESLINKIGQEEKIIQEVLRKVQRGEYTNIGYTWLLDKKGTIEGYKLEQPKANETIDNEIRTAFGEKKKRDLESLKKRMEDSLKRSVEFLNKIEKNLNEPITLFLNYKKAHENLKKDPKAVENIFALYTQLKNLAKKNISLYKNFVSEMREKGFPEKWVDQFYYDALEVTISKNIESALASYEEQPVQQNVLKDIKDILESSKGEKKNSIIEYLKACGNLKNRSYDELRKIRNTIQGMK